MACSGLTQSSTPEWSRSGHFRSDCLRKNIIGLSSLVAFGISLYVNRKWLICCCGERLHLCKDLGLIKTVILDLKMETKFE